MSQFDTHIDLAVIASIAIYISYAWTYTYTIDQYLNGYAQFTDEGFQVIRNSFITIFQKST